MKPGWKDAPDWANYLAMDEDGEWYWFESEPNAHVYNWQSRKGRTELAAQGPEWRKTLEFRPASEEPWGRDE